LNNITVELTIKDQIIAAQKGNKGIRHIKEKVRNKKETYFRIDESDVLWFKNRLVVPKVPELSQLILDECHTQFFKEQNQANHMCAQEVHTYVRIKKYQKQCYYITYT
jgi:hypothetical protein